MTETINVTKLILLAKHRVTLKLHPTSRVVTNPELYTAAVLPSTYFVILKEEDE